jgi:hypothetical protein
VAEIIDPATKVKVCDVIVHDEKDGTYLRGFSFLFFGFVVTSH